MLEDAKRALFSKIVVHRVDRLEGVGWEEVSELLEQLNALGISVVSATEA